jgi:hypothetical protein
MAMFEAVTYLIIIILATAGIFYLLRRFVWNPIKIWFQTRSIMKKYKNHQINEKHLIWCNEKYEKGWSYLDAYEYAFFFFKKSEVPEVLYTFLMVQQAKSIGGKK